MKFDRNTVLGFVILAALFFAYFFYTNREAVDAYRKQKAIEDSIANASRPKIDTVAMKMDSAKADTVNRLTNAGDFKDAATGTEHLIFAENRIIRVAFTNKGGIPKYVELKKFKNQDSGLVRLANSDFDRISYAVNTGNNTSAQSCRSIFSAS